MKHHEGYERMVREPSPSAVRWWYFETEHDFVFARGGLCRTTRIARGLLRDARQQMPLERDALSRARLAHFRMKEDGELVELPPLVRCGY